MKRVCLEKLLAEACESEELLSESVSVSDEQAGGVEQAAVIAVTRFMQKRIQAESAVESGEEAPVDLGCPELVDRKLGILKKAIAENSSLRHCKELAKGNKMGYVLKDGLLFH